MYLAGVAYTEPLFASFTETDALAASAQIAAIQPENPLWTPDQVFAPNIDLLTQSTKTVPGKKHQADIFW